MMDSAISKSQRFPRPLRGRLALGFRWATSDVPEAPCNSRCRGAPKCSQSQKIGPPKIAGTCGLAIEVTQVDRTTV